LRISNKKKEPAFNKLLGLVLENIGPLDKTDHGRKLIKKLCNTYPEVKRYVNKYRRKNHHHFKKHKNLA